LYVGFLESGWCWLRVASRYTGVSIYPAFPFIRVWDVECVWRLVVLVVCFRWGQIGLLECLRKLPVFRAIEVSNGFLLGLRLFLLQITATVAR
jgi:hypothetical protein